MVAFRGPDVVNVAVSFWDTEFGWMVGVGLEYGFTPNWSAKIEYNFMNLIATTTGSLSVD